MRPLTKEIIKQTMLFGLIMGTVGGGALYLRTESLGGLAFGFLVGLSGGLIICVIRLVQYRDKEAGVAQPKKDDPSKHANRIRVVFLTLTISAVLVAISLRALGYELWAGILLVSAIGLFIAERKLV